MSDIGKKIKQKREELGYTQEELANKLGYKSKTTIAKIECGANDIVQSKVLEFAKALNTTPAFLMGWEDSDNKSKDYYLDPAAAELAQEVYDRPELKILFDATRNVSKEDIQFVIDMLDRMKK